MSKSGHIFRIERDVDTSKRIPNIVDALKGPESAKALSLLQQNIHLHAEGGADPVILSIQEVETYPGLEGRYEKAFDSTDREANSLFIVKFRGGHMINVVVDPEKKSVIYIKGVKSSGSKSKSAGSQFKKALGGDIMRLDGMSLDDPDCPVELVDKSLEQNLIDIAVTSRKKVEASGTRAKVGNVVVPKS